jgi:osmotically-inducible protein OsmY
MQPLDPQVMEFAEVRKVRFGADVEASDGTAGKVDCVVAEATTRAISAVGIKAGLFEKVRFVPLHQVAGGTASSVTLRVPLAEILQAPATASGVILKGSTGVGAGGRNLGRLTQVTIHAETGVLRHLVVERAGREVLVPAGVVTAISAKQISTDLDATAQRRLTPYRDDEELAQEATAAIYDYVPLRVDLPGFAVVAIDGVIWLRGHVSSDINRRLIADQLVGIRGVSEVHNDLVADTDLAPAISMALARDPRTAGEHIGVYPLLGMVTLRGNVHTQAARQAAQQIASTAPGVVGVESELHLDQHARVLPVLAAIADTEDVVPGGR